LPEASENKNARAQKLGTYCTHKYSDEISSGSNDEERIDQLTGIRRARYDTIHLGKRHMENISILN
jgi:hypothetical protein